MEMFTDAIISLIIGAICVLWHEGKEVTDNTKAFAIKVLTYGGIIHVLSDLIFGFLGMLLGR